MSQSASTVLPAFPFARPHGNPFDPPEAEHHLRADAAVSKVALPAGGWAWLVTRHAEVRMVLRHPAFSADITRPNFPLVGPVPPQDERSRAGTFIRMDPPEHTRYRRMLTAEFMIKSVQRVAPQIQETVDAFLDTMLAAGPPADLIGQFALAVPSSVICHLLGVPYEDHAFFQKRSNTLLDNHATPEAMRDAMEELRGYFEDLVQRRQREPGDDLIGRLAGYLSAGELRLDDAVGVALLLLIAGHETTANMIGLGTVVLMQHPREFAALRSDPGRAPALVEELLRYLTIVHHGLPRVALVDVTVGGQLIRAGEGVIALLSSANRDSAVYARPDVFDVDRGGQQHVAFGFGAHQCIGQPLARAEMRSAFTTLARRVPTLALAVPLSEVVLRPDSFVYGVHRLPVRW